MEEKLLFIAGSRDVSKERESKLQVNENMKPLFIVSVVPSNVEQENDQIEWMKHNTSPATKVSQYMEETSSWKDLENLCTMRVRR